MYPSGRHDNYGSVLAAHPDSRKGGHLQTSGSQPIVYDGLPNLHLPEALGIRNAPRLRRRRDDARTPWVAFHGSTTRSDHIEHRLQAAASAASVAEFGVVPHIQWRDLLGGLTHERESAA